MQDSRTDQPVKETTRGRERYAAVFVICLVALGLYMAVQTLQSGLSQFDTNLTGRKPLIALFTRLRLKLGDRVFLQALVGKNGWLEYTGDKNIDTFQNRPTLPAGGIERIAANIAVLDEELRAQNITLLVVIPPNKATIYPDTVPEQIQKIGSQSQLDQLVSYMKVHGPPVLLDLRSALITARQQRAVFYKTDTHWNSYGAFVGYTEIMKALGQTYPELQPRDLRSFKMKNVPPKLYDIPIIMGSTSLMEPSIELIPKESTVHWVVSNEDESPLGVSYTSQDNLPSLLMYHDSFGAGLRPFLALGFSKATFIHVRSSYPTLLTMGEVSVVRPNIVIIEFVERDLPYLDGWLQRFLAKSK